MKIRIESCCVLGMLLVVLLLPGCKKPKPNASTANGFSAPDPGGTIQNVRGAATRTIELNDMQTLALEYYNYTLTNNMPPANLEALGLNKTQAKLYAAIKAGDIIVYWGVDGTKLPQPSTTVLAYPKDAATRASVPVATYNGKALKMPKQDFDKAARGGK